MRIYIYLHYNSSSDSQLRYNILLARYTECVLNIKWFLHVFLSQMRYLCFYLHYKLNFNNNCEKMYKFTIDWSNIMIISKNLEKIQFILFIYKKLDDKIGISVRLNCNLINLPMDACHERTFLYILSDDNNHRVNINIEYTFGIRLKKWWSTLNLRALP